ncbi:MAG: hypothetical protein ACRDJ9_23225, partial [Dehalococcoidia bacterium]
LGFGIVLQRVLPDGTVQSLSAEEAADRLVATLQVELPRLDMSGPHPVDASRIEATGGTYPFLIVDELTFERSLYLRVLTVLLVLLVAAAASFAVFLRPLNELVIDVGALVIGIWGIRSILVGIDAPPGSSVVDLSLSIVILFLFAAITVRALMFLDERARLNVLHPQRRMKDNIPADTDAAPERIPAPPDGRGNPPS